MMPDAMPNVDAYAALPITAERYARAAAFCEWNVRQRVRNASVTPHWLPNGERFWYERQLAAGSEILMVDPGRGTREAQREPLPTTASAPPGRLRSPDGRSHLRLTEGNLYLAPAGGGVFFDVASTAATAPVSRLRRADGAPVMEAETADVSVLTTSEWRAPERFVVAATDGETDVFGALSCRRISIRHAAIR
jgi:hypothetical protein